MLFAQFYQKSAISDKIIEATGDRSVIILDGRYSSATNGKIAEIECSKRGYLAWAIYKGENLIRAHRVSGPWYIHKDKIDNTASAAAYGA